MRAQDECALLEYDLIAVRRSGNACYTMRAQECALLAYDLEDGAAERPCARKSRVCIACNGALRAMVITN